MTVDQTQAVDEARLNELLGRFVNDFGAAGFAATVVIRDKLGLYSALATGPATPAELADRTRTHPRLVTEWLAAQAASGYVTYHPDNERFSLSPGQTEARRPGGRRWLWPRRLHPHHGPGLPQLELRRLRLPPAVCPACPAGGGQRRAG